MPIKTFKDKPTMALFLGLPVKSLPPALRRRAKSKLDQIDIAAVLDDLRVPPGNHLEALQRNRQGQHSIRVNEQWRVCFVWKDGDAFDVEIVDYH